ncbi:MAG: EhaE family protein [Euryarchaeota archaeon]
MVSEPELTLYAGSFMVLAGVAGAAIGPARSDPVVKALNLDLASTGICLIFLAFNHTLALITYIAVGAFATPILMRAILRVEAGERE